VADELNRYRRYATENLVEELDRRLDARDVDKKYSVANPFNDVAIDAIERVLRERRASLLVV
jgi:hypothetical protein